MHTTNNISGCDSTVVLNLVVHPLPDATISASATQVCAGNEIKLSATEGFKSYDWGNGPVANNKLVVTPENSMVYSLTVVSQTGCIAKDSILIQSINIQPTNLNYQICEGDSILIFGKWEKLEGIYTLLYTGISQCDSVVTINLQVNTLPFKFTLSGGGSYGQDKQGLPIYLSGSQNNVIYSLYNDSALVLSVPGNGIEIYFGEFEAGEYFVWAEDIQAGCSSLMLGKSIITTNLYNYLDGKSGIIIYPNPAKDVVNISLHYESNIRVYNNAGQIVLTLENMTSDKINIQHLTPGLYFIEITDYKNKFIYKLVKH
jgi:hypothetical protein